MHPPLFREHPKCADAVQLLISCHEENKISKFFGACNDVKIQLDRCFKLEKEEKRQLNLQNARKFDSDFDKLLQEKGQKWQ